MDIRSLKRKVNRMTQKAKTIVHVNQHMIKYNKKWGTEYPVLTVKHKGKTYYGHQVTYHEGSETIYRPLKPLSCGATVWVETEGDVTIFDWTAESHKTRGLTHPMIKAERKVIRRLGREAWENSETSELVKQADSRFDTELKTVIDHEQSKLD